MSETNGSNGNGSLSNWSVVHEQAVALHLTGWNIEKIGDLLEMPIKWVQDVLESHEAEELAVRLQKTVRRKLLKNIEDSLVGLGELAVMNLQETLQTSIEPGTTAKKHQDRMSLEVLKMLRGSDELSELLKSQQGGFSQELEKRLATALEISNEIDHMITNKHKALRDLQSNANEQVYEGEVIELPE